MELAMRSRLYSCLLALIGVSAFFLSIEKPTDADYSLDPSTVSVMKLLPGGEGLEQDDSLSLSAREIPAKQKVVVSISGDMDYQGDRNDSAKLSEAFELQLKELDGFVLFDKAHRYKIVLPNGWPNVKASGKPR
jgi:hypothetical protein